MIVNRVSKLKQIENKMLKKIDKTRQEAEKVRLVKQKNNERLEQKVQCMRQEETELQEKRRSILTDKSAHKHQITKQLIRKRHLVLENARQIRLASQENHLEKERSSMLSIELNKVQASIVSD